MNSACYLPMDFSVGIYRWSMMCVGKILPIRVLLTEF